MNERLEAVLKRARSWPEEKQAWAARLLEDLESETEDDVYVLSSEEKADLEEALKEIENGEIASDAEVEAVFRKRGASG